MATHERILKKFGISRLRYPLYSYVDLEDHK